MAAIKGKGIAVPCPYRICRILPTFARLIQNLKLVEFSCLNISGNRSATSTLEFLSLSLGFLNGGNVQLLQLLVVNGRWSIGEEATSLLGFGEGDRISN